MQHVLHVITSLFGLCWPRTWFVVALVDQKTLRSLALLFNCYFCINVSFWMGTLIGLCQANFFWMEEEYEFKSKGRWVSLTLKFTSLAFRIVSHVRSKLCCVLSYRLILNLCFVYYLVVYFSGERFCQMANIIYWPLANLASDFKKNCQGLAATACHFNFMEWNDHSSLYGNSKFLWFVWLFYIPYFNSSDHIQKSQTFDKPVVKVSTSTARGS